MAGSEQRPTDEVLGHGNKVPEDETAGDDRGRRNPADAEGHGYRWGQDTEAVDEDDVAGHSAKVRLGQRIEAGDEVEGHGFRWGQDTEAVDEDEAADDTKGHFGRYGG
jgi:hypothetical protein